MAVSGFRTLLVKRLPRVYEAVEAAVGVETAKPIDVEKLMQLLNLMVAYRVPVFSNFAGFLQRCTPSLGSAATWRRWASGLG
jgi:hypothetical protein